MPEQPTQEAAGGPILLVGNPNVGKSVLFRQLTGHYAVVSNYPGTTVEITSADLNLGHGRVATLVDTPGINTLLPFSEDERVTQRIILERSPSLIIQVGDAKNLVRTLQLTLLLLEVRVPLLLVLNMSDEAARKGMVIDTGVLERALGVPVVTTSAVQGGGIGHLRKALAAVPPGRHLLPYPDNLAAGMDSLSRLLEGHPVHRRLLALLLLGRDPHLAAWLASRYPPATLEALESTVAALERDYPKPLAQVMAQSRDRLASRLAEEAVRRPAVEPGNLAHTIGVLTREPLTGIPVFLATIYLMYLLVGRFAAGTLVDFLEEVVFGTYVNPWVAALLVPVPWEPVRDLFVGEFGLVSMGLTYAVAIVLPIVSVFFFCFGFLEDSGYLPRLAVMSDRIFRRVGLNGKAILPMVLGLGCSTMATLTSRILETSKERLIVIVLLALGIPCSAQLGVMLAIMASLSPWAVGTVVAVILFQLLLVGFAASRLLPGEGSDFIMEVPPIRWPRVSNLAMKTYLRIEWFLKEAIPVFLLGTFILFLLDRVGFLDWLTGAASPLVVRWLHLPAETATIFVMGFFRRDYGAAGLFEMVKEGIIDPNQMVVSLVVITLFVPCIANFLVIIKEQGLKKGLAIAGFIFPFAVLVGGLLRIALDLARVRF
jgi:ferrous iron transport protein B